MDLEIKEVTDRFGTRYFANNCYFDDLDKHELVEVLETILKNTKCNNFSIKEDISIRTFIFDNFEQI